MKYLENGISEQIVVRIFSLREHVPRPLDTRAFSTSNTCLICPQSDCGPVHSCVYKSAII